MRRGPLWRRKESGAAGALMAPESRIVYLSELLLPPRSEEERSRLSAVQGCRRLGATTIAAEAMARDAVGVAFTCLRSGFAATSTSSPWTCALGNCGSSVDVPDVVLVSLSARTPTGQAAIARTRKRAPCVAEVMLPTRSKGATHDDPGMRRGTERARRRMGVGLGGRWMSTSLPRARTTGTFTAPT